MESRGGERFRYHGESTRVVITYIAKDGYATFYVAPPPRAADYPSGYTILDKSDLTLDQICQSYSLNLLKVYPADIGESFYIHDTPPPNFETSPETPNNWMVNETLQVSWVNRDFEHLKGLAISPIVYIENGVRKNIVPARLKIWSPVADFPKLGRQRFFQWTHADFWWEPEELDIDPSKATEIAAFDLIALETIAQVDDFSFGVTSKGAEMHAADILDNYCNEFLELIDNNGQYEEPLHQWLNNPNHHVFFDPHAIEVRSKVPFGSKKSDFVFRKPDGTYTLVEIEKATAPIFRGSDQEPTYEFNHACMQVRDWQRYIRENIHTVRNELGLVDIYEPRGMIVIGRSMKIAGRDAINRWKDIKNTQDFAVYSYDELCDRVRALAANLRTILLK